MKIIKGVIAIFAVALSLSGCGGLTSLPDDQRYQFINQAKEAVDLPSAGAVISERYDHGDGVFSPSFFIAEIKDENSYETLKNRINKLDGVRDCIEVETQLTCKKGQVDIFLSQSKDVTSKVFFKLTDGYSGRTSK